jgi:hypothetical protein
MKTLSNFTKEELLEELKKREEEEKNSIEYPFEIINKTTIINYEDVGHINKKRLFVAEITNNNDSKLHMVLKVTGETYKLDNTRLLYTVTKAYQELLDSRIPLDPLPSHENFCKQVEISEIGKHGLMGINITVE